MVAMAGRAIRSREIIPLRQRLPVYAGLVIGKLRRADLVFRHVLCVRVTTRAGLR